MFVREYITKVAEMPPRTDNGYIGKSDVTNPKGLSGINVDSIHTINSIPTHILLFDILLNPSNCLII